MPFHDLPTLIRQDEGYERDCAFAVLRILGNRYTVDDRRASVRSSLRANINGRPVIGVKIRLAQIDLTWKSDERQAMLCNFVAIEDAGIQLSSLEACDKLLFRKDQ